MTYSDVPSAKNFPGIELTDTSKVKSANDFMRGKPSEVVYEDDIYVGYRYYSTFQVPVAYEFGYGLSYTSFEYSNLKLSTTEFKDQLTISVDVKNTGKVTGREVVQVHLSTPAKKLSKPEEEMKGFGKTKALNPGETQTLSFTLTAKDLASFDTPTSSWMAEAGSYTVKVGASSRAIKQTTAFTLATDLTVLKVNKVLSPDRAINTLAPKK